MWTTTGLGASDLAVVDEFLAAPDESADSSVIAAAMAERGGVPVIVPAGER